MKPGRPKEKHIDGYFTLSEMMKELGICKSTVYSWMWKKIIPTPDKTLYSNFLYWSNSEVEEIRKYIKSVEG